MKSTKEVQTDFEDFSQTYYPNQSKNFKNKNVKPVNRQLKQEVNVSLFQLALSIGEQIFKFLKLLRYNSYHQ